MYFKNAFASSGDTAPVPSSVQPDGSLSFPSGFGILYATDPATSGLNIPREETNYLFNVITAALQQYQQYGVPDFITSADNGGSPFPYAAGATVRYGGLVYYSLASSNTAIPTDTAYWGRVVYGNQQPTASALEYYGSTLPVGYVWANGQTVGNASSNATGRANADTQALFTALWGATANTELQLYTSAGATVARGVSAAADFAANRAIATPNRCGTVCVGRDGMGGASTTGKITIAGCGISGTTLGASGGEQSVQLTSNQNGQHSHAATSGAGGVHSHSATASAVGDHGHPFTLQSGSGGSSGYSGGLQKITSGTANTYTNAGASSTDAGTQIGGAGAHSHTVTVDNSASHTHTISVDNSGLGAPHLNVQPSIVANYILKL